MASPSGLLRRVGPQEQILVDVRPRATMMLMPVLRLIILTGVVWMAVGMIDSYRAGEDITVLEVPLLSPATVATVLPVSAAEGLRQVLIIGWMMWVVLRMARLFWQRQRTRLIVTNACLYLTMPRAGDLRIGRHQARVVRRRGSALHISVEPGAPPIVVKPLPKTGRIMEFLR